MIIQAELKCKQTGCEADPCAVDKVIELPSQRFQQFSRALLADYDFIAENKNAIRHDDDSRHCLLILDAEGTDGFLVDPQGYNYARYSAFVPNARSLLTPDMGVDRSYLSPAKPWRDESRDEMLRMTLRVDGKPDYTLVLPADEEYLDAVKAYLDIDVFADAMLCDIRFKVPYIGELIRDTDCPAVEDYNDFAEALEDIWQQDGALLTYAAVLEAERPDISFLTTTTTVDTLRFSKPIRKVTKNTKSGVQKSKIMCYNYYIYLCQDEKRWTKYQFCKGITPVSMNFTERSGGK